MDGKHRQKLRRRDQRRQRSFVNGGLTLALLALATGATGQERTIAPFAQAFASQSGSPKKFDPLSLRCDQYAKQAVAEADQLASPTCHSSNAMGPPGRWTRDYLNHYNWCRSAPAAAAASEESARKEELRACNVNDRAAQDCVSYLEATVGTVQGNKASRCGFTGPRWYSGPTVGETMAAHFHWCLSASVAARTEEAQMRMQYLGLCFNKPSAERCYGYAKGAINDEQQNVSLGCGFSGPAWQSSLDNHWLWCSGASAGAPEGQQKMRAEQLATCRNTPRGSGVSQGNTCAVTVTLTTTECENATDGSPSEYSTPVTVSACGPDEAAAVDNAKAKMRAAGHTLTDDPSEGEPGKCTWAQQ